MNDMEQSFWKAVTWFGELPGIILLLIISTIPSIRSLKQAYFDFLYEGTFGDHLVAIIIGWIGVFLSYSIGTVIKYFYYKPRPIPRDTSTLRKRINAGSMPSIHSSNATICAIAFIMSRIRIINWYLMSNNYIELVILLLLIGMTIFLTISLSRVVLQKHYPIDVLAGFYLGFIIGTTLLIYIKEITHAIDILFSIFI